MCLWILISSIGISYHLKVIMGNGSERNTLLFNQVRLSSHELLSRQFLSFVLKRVLLSSHVHQREFFFRVLNKHYDAKQIASLLRIFYHLIQNSDKPGIFYSWKAFLCEFLSNGHVLKVTVTHGSGISELTNFKNSTGTRYMVYDFALITIADEVSDLE